MHPLLGNARRLWLYLAAWIPLGGLLAYGLSVGGGVAWTRAVALAAPLALVYAFVCLSVWYTCRVLPLDGARLAPTLGAQLAAAVVAGGLWAAAAAGLGPLAALAPSAALALFPLGVLLYLLAAAGYYLWMQAEATRQTEWLARDAELRALKAQINPHFLFNSLNSISALTGSEPARAREMCVLLGDFFRRTLRLGEQRGVPLAEELDLTRAYLAVEQVRFGTRLALEETIAAPALEVVVPPLLLQPLVENAVVHGVAHLLDDGWIRLEAACQGDSLRLTVANRFDPEAVRRGGAGVGLANVRGRLSARYGGAARFESSVAGDQFLVTIVVPREVAE